MKIGNNRGGTLVFTLIVFMVLMIFGTFIMSFMVSENKMAISHKKNTQAYYLARSGAVAVESAILSLKDTEDLETKLNAAAEEGLIVDINWGGKLDGITVSVKKDAKDNLTIKSTGEVDGTKEVVTKVMSKELVSSSENSNLGLDMSIYAGSKLDMGENYNMKAQIKGATVAPSESCLEGGKRKGTTIKYETRNYPTLNSSKIPNVVNKFIGQEIYSDIDKSTEFTSEVIKFNGVSINTDNKDIDLVVNKLELSESEELKIVGSGKVRIFVKEELLFDGVQHINKSGIFNQLEIYYYGSRQLEIKKNVHMWANTFVKNSYIKVVGNALTGLIYAPESEIELDKNKEINGIVGKIIDVQKNPKIKNPPLGATIPKDLVDWSDESVGVGEESSGSYSVYKKGYFK